VGGSAVWCLAVLGLLSSFCRSLSSVLVSSSLLDCLGSEFSKTLKHARDAGALKEPQSTRLGTRTKESNTCASVVVPF